MASRAVAYRRCNDPVCLCLVVLEGSKLLETAALLVTRIVGEDLELERCWVRGTADRKARGGGGQQGRSN